MLVLEDIGKVDDGRRISIRVASEAIQVHGGYGFTEEFAVSRFYRGTHYGSLGGGATETLRNRVGRKLVDQTDLASGCLGMNMSEVRQKPQ